MLKSKIQIAILACLTLCMVVAPLHYASARGLVPCGGYKDDGSKEHPCTVVDMFVLVAKVTNWLLSMVGVYAVFKIIESGFNLITTQGNEEAVKKNQGAITNAVIGFVFAMLAFLFMNTATNLLLRSKCQIDLTQPLQYLTIQNYDTCK